MRRLLVIACLAAFCALAGCVGTQARVGLSTNEGPREKPATN